MPSSFPPCLPLSLPPPFALTPPHGLILNHSHPLGSDASGKKRKGVGVFRVERMRDRAEQFDGGAVGRSIREIAKEGGPRQARVLGCEEILQRDNRRCTNFRVGRPGGGVACGRGSNAAALHRATGVLTLECVQLHGTHKFRCAPALTRGFTTSPTNESSFALELYTFGPREF